jgi:hypothetical protein
MNRQILGIIAAFSLIATGVAKAQLSGKDSLLCGGVVLNMQNEGVEIAAHGESVYVLTAKKGTVTMQRMVVSVRGLTPNNPYHLFAQLSGGGDPVNVVDFTADLSGNAVFVYNTNSAGKPPINPLPDQLNPASRIHQLAVVSLTTNVLVQTNVILLADFDTSTDFNLQTKRTVSTNGVVLNLLAKATVLKAQIKLKATGLARQTNYLLVVDGEPQATLTSSASGKLSFVSTPPPLKVWTADSIALWDTSSNIVAGITLR